MDKNITHQNRTYRGWVKNVYNLCVKQRKTSSQPSTVSYQQVISTNKAVQKQLFPHYLYPQKKQTHTQEKSLISLLLKTHLYTVSTAPIITKMN